MEPIRVLQENVIMDPGGIESLLMNLYRHMDRDVVQFDFLLHRPQKGTFDDEIESLGGRIYRTEPFNPFHHQLHLFKFVILFKILLYLDYPMIDKPQGKQNCYT